MKNIHIDVYNNGMKILKKKQLLRVYLHRSVYMYIYILFIYF